ncbi:MULTISPECIES: ACT domain-containing protein [Rhizobium]|uniref:ACT domain-containing protein n=1 Tax=Rhizobium changzhiense TaxID=2692317 RepID=A0A7Z0UG86_9HYPH|nr:MULTISPECIES: ACT domain-containing protein [Rhizobium]MCV9946472.1 ACT domain-containing protein [Rhizobium sp. BT-175]MCW0020182.1 ACT domain-containing protein [Rhizobium sp. BT-226]NZD65187.1 ACT domain-containing protein [Rhizobium changzhiense]
MAPRITIRELEGSYAIARLAPDAAIPAWADGEGFVSIGRSDEELSIVCRAERVPADIKHDGGWSCYKFQGPFAFNEAGILLSVIRPLSESNIGIFAVSTFDTDNLLIKTSDKARADELLAAAGHTLL